MENPFMIGKIHEKTYSNSFIIDYKRFIQNKTVLDVGCSSGTVGDHLKNLNCEYIGMDINPIALKEAKRKGESVLLGDAGNIPIPDNYIDIVICQGVIHHTDRPFTCISELVRITKKGGLIFIYVYKKYSPYYFIRKVTYPIRFFNQSFLKSFFLNKHLWNFFADQILTPIAHFYTKKQMEVIFSYFGLIVIDYKKTTLDWGMHFVCKKL